MHLLRPHFALGVLRELRDGLEVTFDFSLRRQLAAGETLHCILNDRCERLIAHDDVTPVLGLLELVTDGNEERVIAALDAGFHLLNRLALVLHPLQFALRGDDGFNELTFRRVLELKVQALGFRSELGQLGAKADVELCIPREALEVVKDDDIVRVRIVPEILKQGRHAGTLHEIAPGALHIAEHFLNDIPPRSGVFTASVFLTAAPITF